VRLLAGAAVVLAMTTVAPAPSQAAAGDWTIVRLEALPGDDVARVTDVNDAGVAVGVSSKGLLESTAVVWNAAGVPTALPEPQGGGRGRANAINEAGVIVGHVQTADVVGLGAHKAVRWVPNGSGGYTVEVLGTGTVSDVNAAGVMVGDIASVPVIEPAIFRPGQSPAELPTASGVGQAVRLNDASVVVGLDVPDPVAWAFGNRHRLYEELDDLEVEVKDVTNSFYTLGWLTVGERILSFVQAPGGAIFPLAPAPHTSAAHDLNDIGLAAGFARGTSGGTAHAALFVYGTAVPVRDLLSTPDQAVWTSMQDAVAVNDNAVVVGEGRIGQSDRPEAFLLRPPQ
jgi:hypothetical protein